VSSRFPLIPKRYVPKLHEQLDALVELSEVPGLMDVFVIEAWADERHEQAQLPCDLPRPQRLYPAARVGLVLDPELPVPAIALDGVVCLRPCVDVRTLCFRAAHELAEELLRRSRWRHNHTDVQRFACALLLPAAVVRLLLRRLGFRGALRELMRRHRTAPRWVILYRVAVVAMRAERSTA
jgi:hypothetical protein